MIQRLGVLGSVGVLLASAFVAVATLGASPAHADSFEDWATVAAGGAHTCGVRNNGKLYCWGADAFGQVGDGDNPDPATTPRRIGTYEDWTAVTAGDSHTCGIRHGGKLYCWGWDELAQVGDGDNPIPAIVPRRIGTFEDWSNIAAGFGHTCGIRHGGKLYCWGSDSDGQIGDGDGDSSPVTTPLRIGSFEDWNTITAGGVYTCGIRHGGKLYCWGSNEHGQAGAGGTTDDVTTPRRVGSFEDWNNITAGFTHTCGIRHGGKLYCWGDDSFGDVGDGPGFGSTSPVRIGTFEDWANVSAGAIHTCGVRANGKLYCWGWDLYGQVGDGDGDSSPVTTPRRIGTFEDWSTSSAGQHHSCGIRHVGELYCWGEDLSGQIGDGDGDSTPVSTPLRI
jgi:alpha-tubulin suppressor-like RCC1 family protein